MNVTVVGNGPIEAVLVGGIHGDEPCGPAAIRRFLDSEPDLNGSVKCITANTRAIEASERYIDADLNRVFPGDPDSDVYEEVLAHQLVSELPDVPILSFHSTQSSADPFGLVNGTDSQAVEIGSQLPIDHLVDVSKYATGRFVQHPKVVEVECGQQKSQAAEETAVALLYAFLRNLGLLDGSVHTGETDGFTITGTLQKDPEKSYTVLVENFEVVPEGAVVARADDGMDIIADDSFVPVLVSANGYESILGQTAQPYTFPTVDNV